MITASIALATLDDVLRHPAMRTLADTVDGLSLEDRETLEEMILAGSLDVEDACGRWFRSRDDWAEVLDVACGQRVFYLRAFPVREIVAVRYAEDGDFDAAQDLPARAYAVLRGGRLGELTLRPTADALPESPASLRVTYKGGLAAMVHQLPANLRQGLVDQIAFAWKRSTNPEVQSLSHENGAVTYFRNGDGTPTFARAVSKYRARIF